MGNLLDRDPAIENEHDGTYWCVVHAGVWWPGLRGNRFGDRLGADHNTCQRVIKRTSERASDIANRRSRKMVRPLPLRRRDPQERLLRFIDPQFRGQTRLKENLVQDPFVGSPLGRKVDRLFQINPLPGHRIVIEQERQINPRL